MAKTKAKTDSRGPIEQNFEMFSQAAMRPRRYVEKPLPKSVTVEIRPEYMEILHIIASRIGTSRANAATYILEMGAIEAAIGCGFTFDEEGKISDDQKNWDMTPRSMGFSHVPAEDKE